MKKKLFFLAVLILFAISFTSCEKECKTCKKVYYVGTTYDHEDASSQYCGLELAAIDGVSRTVGGFTVTWECN
jgi:hypothetical protein